MRKVLLILFLVTVWLLLRSRQSYYADVTQHSFEMAGFKDDLHKEYEGNFYFYIKDPKGANFFRT